MPSLVKFHDCDSCESSTLSTTYFNSSHSSYRKEKCEIKSTQKVNSRKRNSEWSTSAKDGRKSFLHKQCQRIEKEKELSGTKRVTYGFIQKILDDYKYLYPWLTRDILNKSYDAYKKDNDHDSNNTDPLNVNANMVNKGGRPIGTTLQLQVKDEMNKSALLNEIADIYQKEKTCNERKNTNMKSGRLRAIIEDTKLKWNLPKMEVSLETIRSRVKRNHTEVYQRNGGVKSPMLSVEPTLVMLMIQMARIRRSFNFTTGLSLANSLIKGTEIETQVLEFKRQHKMGPDDDEGMLLGAGYWKGFWNRNHHLLERKRGQKYAHDRDNWTTYRNFGDMYDHIYDEMVDAGVAEKLTEPVWMDKMGNIVENKKDSFGEMCTHVLTHPEMCFVADEVGSNISMRTDGHIGGEKLICERGSVPYKRVSVTEKHFTVLGLTLLTGETLMCVVIITGKNRIFHHEIGVNIFVPAIGKHTDKDYWVNNLGPGKRFPGGPSCNVNGKNVPCMVCWSEKGSMTGEILTDVFITLDNLKVFNRKEGVPPFALLDGHESRIHLSFLQYINHDDHPWAVCIGVPYGTALWQVGDSKQQHGAYKIALTKAKTMLIEAKAKACLQATIQPYEIMVILNIAWKKSFAVTESNRKAIWERGWNPLNRVLLQNPQIVASMTKT